MANPLVSAILSAYNEESHIGSLLASIKEQGYPFIEIIVIDDGSTDKTAKIAKKFGARVYTRSHQDRSLQRNFAASQAKGKYLLLLDADMVLTPQVVSFCLAQKKDVVVVPEQSFGKNYWAKCKALERNCYIGDSAIEAARFVSASAFKAVGGYNPEMIAGEDWDLHRRLAARYQIGRASQYIMHNEGELSFWKVLKKKLYYAKKSDAYISENVAGIKDVARFIVRPAIWRNWRQLLADPIHFPGMVLLVWGEILVGGLGAVIFKPVFLHRLLKI